MNARTEFKDKQTDWFAGCVCMIGHNAYKCPLHGGKATGETTHEWVKRMYEEAKARER